MKRPIAAVAAAAVATGLFSLLPVGVAHADPVCEDPSHPIDTELDTADTVAVGTSKTQKLHLSVYTKAGCDVTGATAKVTWPHGSKKVKLTKAVQPSGIVAWEGELKVAPKTLRNSDAGVWPTTFTVSGEHSDTLSVESRVLRASRLSFNAGPEPAADTITYAGKLERASWNSDKYAGYSQSIEIRNYFDEHEEPDVLATLTTTSNGTYRSTQSFHGPGDYEAFYAGNATTYLKHSAEDHIA